MGRGGAEAWVTRLDAWLAPFLSALPRGVHRRWVPSYVLGLLLPRERKSVEPMAARVCPGQSQQPRHFASTSTWPHERLERMLAASRTRRDGRPPRG